MDLRPVDTEATVNTRNRIRLSSTIALLGVFIYISVQDSFTGAHISFVHLLHLIVQPVILVITILDQSGLPSYASYALAVWAFTKAPIPVVTSLRETSILLSIFIGYFLLKEKITPIKIISIITILGGVVSLKLL